MVSDSSIPYKIFAAFRGKDSRFAMEQNLVPSVAGSQETGWLFQQTQTLRHFGVKVTCSGDTPFLNRLIIAAGNDISRDHPSSMALYVEDKEFVPTLCHEDTGNIKKYLRRAYGFIDYITGRRTDLTVPFRENVPEEALLSIESVLAICPDATHLVTRCTENDLRRMAQKIVMEKERESTGSFPR